MNNLHLRGTLRSADLSAPTTIDSQLLEVDWKLKNDKGKEVHYGSTKNKVYITGAAAPGEYETVLDLSCAGAQDKTPGVDDDAIVESIWGKFGTGAAPTDVKRVNGDKLQYYGSYLTNNTDFASLLKDADGQCGAWTDLLIECLTTAGIASARLKHSQFFSTTGDGFFVKNWSAVGAGTSGDPNFPFQIVPQRDFVGAHSYNIAYGDVTDAAGIPGQNNPDPASFFGNHQMVEYTTTAGAVIHYDPSYGARYTSVAQIDNSIDYFYKIVQPVRIDETIHGIDLNGDGALGFIDWAVLDLQANPAGIQLTEKYV